MRPSWYRAGNAETKTLDRPPAAVAEVWTMLFSLGPKEPPRMGIWWGVMTEMVLRTPNPTMA